MAKQEEVKEFNEKISVVLRKIARKGDAKQRRNPVKGTSTKR